jgi:hypothetical protein
MAFRYSSVLLLLQESSHVKHSPDKEKQGFAMSERFMKSNLRRIEPTVFPRSKSAFERLPANLAEKGEVHEDKIKVRCKIRVFSMCSEWI